MKNKTFALIVLGSTILLLACFASITYIVDPLFHYNAPHLDFEYGIYNERYQNDGIMRNFKYDALITGTSMTENFKTSELDDLFDTTSIKVPFMEHATKKLIKIFNEQFLTMIA